ncbi:hypothetical protein CVS40_2862 [Lucilia cuprina]|nr:hypothetical protein CVS40_2862 [Lucilia cuprina]
MNSPFCLNDRLVIGCYISSMVFMKFGESSLFLLLLPLLLLSFFIESFNTKCRLSRGRNFLPSFHH